MGKISAKNKIFIMLASWLILSGLMFFYFFGLLDNANQHALDDMMQQNQNLSVLNSERESYLQSQKDLQQLAQESIQPGTFFSEDITLVDEIKTLEEWGQRLGVQMTLTGVSGTADTSPEAKTITPIVMVPYNINLVGDLTQAVNFLEVLENLDFITHINSISMGAATKGQVVLNLSANFYIKK